MLGYAEDQALPPVRRASAGPGHRDLLAGRGQGSGAPRAGGRGWVSSMKAQASRPEMAVRTAATVTAASRLAGAAVMPPIRAPMA